MNNREGSLRLKRLKRRKERYNMSKLRGGPRNIEPDTINGKKLSQQKNCSISITKKAIETHYSIKHKQNVII